jgi:hypothetical protein
MQGRPVRLKIRKKPDRYNEGWNEALEAFRRVFIDLGAPEHKVFAIDSLHQVVNSLRK